MIQRGIGHRVAGGAHGLNFRLIRLLGGMERLKGLFLVLLRLGIVHVIFSLHVQAKSISPEAIERAASRAMSFIRAWSATR